MIPNLTNINNIKSNVAEMKFGDSMFDTKCRNRYLF